MVAVPVSAACTRPAAETVATFWALLAQVTVRPPKVAPPASWSTTDSCNVPCTPMLAVLGEMPTVLTGLFESTGALRGSPAHAASAAGVPRAQNPWAHRRESLSANVIEPTPFG